MATYPVLSAPNQLTSSEASDTGGEAGSPGPWNGTDDAAAVKVETTSSSSGRVGSASTAKAYEVSGLIDGPRGMILAARAAYWEVWNVVLDTHIYQCFTRSMRLFTPKEHIYEVQTHGIKHVRSCDVPLLEGERGSEAKGRELCACAIETFGLVLVTSSVSM